MNFFRRSPGAGTIEALYGAIVAQARHPAFYRRYAVPDTLDGRLDLLMLHLALGFERLAQDSAALQALGQGLFDRFCRDMDDHLREQGVSDLKVPGQMRTLAAAFFGRQSAYVSALKTGDRMALQAALGRNVYQDETAPAAAALASYAAAAHRALALQDAAALSRGRLMWPDPDDAGGTG